MVGLRWLARAALSSQPQSQVLGWLGAGAGGSTIVASAKFSGARAETSLALATAGPGDTRNCCCRGSVTHRALNESWE